MKFYGFYCFLKMPTLRYRDWKRFEGVWKLSAQLTLPCIDEDLLKTVKTGNFTLFYCKYTVLTEWTNSPLSQLVETLFC